MAASTASLTLPAQVSPPEFALSGLAPHAVAGAEVIALPVVPATDGSPLLGPGAEEIGEALGLDLLDLLATTGGSGATGEITTCPVPLGSAENAALRLVLLVGVGEQSPRDLRRAGAAVARAVRDRSSLATSVPAVCDGEGLTAFVVGLMLGSFGFHMRSGGP